MPAPESEAAGAADTAGKPRGQNREARKGEAAVRASWGRRHPGASGRGRGPRGFPGHTPGKGVSRPNSAGPFPGRRTGEARGGSGAESSCRDIKNATVVDYRNFWPQLRTFSVLLSCPAVPSRRPLPAERAAWGPHNLSGGSRRPSAQRRLPRGRPGGRLGRQRKCAVHTACSHPSATVAAVSPAQRDVAKLFPPAGWQTTLAAKPPKHVS